MVSSTHLNSYRKTLILSKKERSQKRCLPLTPNALLLGTRHGFINMMLKLPKLKKQIFSHYRSVVNHEYALDGQRGVNSLICEQPIYGLFNTIMCPYISASLWLNFWTKTKQKSSPNHGIRQIWHSMTSSENRIANAIQQWLMLYLLLDD